MVIPEWFKIGAKVWFRGFGPETVIVAIEETNNLWLALDYDGQHYYPLDEVEKYWKPVYTGSNDELGTR